MDNSTIDFEGNIQTQPQTTNVNNNQPDDKDDINGGKGNDITGKDNTKQDDVKDKNNDDDTNSSKGELEVGTQVEYDGVTYVVAENGDLVDDKGNVFKEAKDVSDWLKENNFSDDNTDNKDNLSIESIKDAIGIDVTDEDGKDIEFTNDVEGVKNYINSVIAIKSQDLKDGAINKLYADNPLLKEFVDYVQLNGSPKGFGEIPDRSGIVLDKDNDSQLEAVIRMAANEFGNKSLNDNYIKYLKETGNLYTEAKTQLEALVEKDKQYKKNIEIQAQLQREEAQKQNKLFFENIYNKVVTTKSIGEYKLPDTFVKQENGQKITLTPSDFYKYIAVGSVTDDNGNVITPYTRDRNNLNEEERINRDLLDAWLMFTGGTYKDLIDMAVKEDKVRKLVVKSNQQRSARTIKVSKPNIKANIDDIVLS